MSTLMIAWTSPLILSLFVFAQTAQGQTIAPGYEEIVSNGCRFQVNSVYVKQYPQGKLTWSGRCAGGYAEGAGIRRNYDNSGVLYAIAQGDMSRGQFQPTTMVSTRLQGNITFWLRDFTTKQFDKIEPTHVPNWAREIVTSENRSSAPPVQRSTPPPAPSGQGVTQTPARGVSSDQAQTNTVTVKLGKSSCGDSCAIEVPNPHPRALNKTDIFVCDAKDMKPGTKVPVCLEIFGRGPNHPNMEGRMATLTIKKDPRSDKHYWILGGRLDPTNSPPSTNTGTSTSNQPQDNAAAQAMPVEIASATFSGGNAANRQEVKSLMMKNYITNGHLAKCGSRWIRSSGTSSSVIETKGLTFSVVFHDDLNEADRLNGVEYRGVVKPSAIARRESDRNAWGEWQSTADSIDGFMFERKKGVVSHSKIPSIQPFLPITCARLPPA